MRLTREIRFSVGPPLDPSAMNSWAGWPSAAGVQPFVTLQATVEGTPHPQTGYLVNIRAIDRLLRERVVPLFADMAAAGRLPFTCEQAAQAVRDRLLECPPPGTRWVCWKLNLTPFLACTIQEDGMIQLTQSFEFAAAHRLHCPHLSDRENADIFGKCNNPNGHGHNYQLEVTVAGPPDGTTGCVIPLHQLERIVNERVIERFDHKHLNEDCAEFREVNPSVENIARVIWGLLEGHLAGARLAGIRVWETPKTCADYDGKDM